MNCNVEIEQPLASSPLFLQLGQHFFLALFHWGHFWRQPEPCYCPASRAPAAFCLGNFPLKLPRQLASSQFSSHLIFLLLFSAPRLLTLIQSIYVFAPALILIFVYASSSCSSATTPTYPHPVHHQLSTSPRLKTFPTLRHLRLSSLQLLLLQNV